MKAYSYLPDVPLQPHNKYVQLVRNWTSVFWWIKNTVNTVQSFWMSVKCAM